ncbi:hypothetical protein tinsulaeT_28310 [Thalassotalea insulae]|uniref:Peptidase S1 domain-containing protein n=1 Tax=Thalassotalea insulae TaxID=2056778 RepID=A0ABQ6GZ46_9GAMM|nr:trypsin-like serine protease [Thalassotalea insulae]GLX79491.1 hypothetical protein tinsulaeT_28310 [Thalassotalea insulae]
MYRLLVTVLLMVISYSSTAIVIRHDVSPEQYLVEKKPPYLVYMPHEGQGTLIAPNWVLTVAHVIFYDYKGKYLTIGDKEYAIESVIIHPEYRKLDKTVLAKGTKMVMDFQYANQDIALVKLATPVNDVTPIALYPSNDELGQEVMAYGRGATGNGLNGAIYESKKQQVLRKLTNKIDEVKAQWLSITFDQNEQATLLEGIDGSGDSGGPVVVKKDHRTYLAGMFAWDYVEGPLEEFVAGQYGNKSYQVRVSSYLDWISQIIKTN